jgi:hypothetical protein
MSEWEWFAAGFDGVARREQYSAARRHGSHFLFGGNIHFQEACSVHFLAGFRPLSDDVPKRVSDSAYGDIRARRMRERTRLV